MNTPILQHAAKQAGAPIRDGQHYLHLLTRAKWYILVSGLVTLISTTAFVFLMVRPENPELQARALIGLERTTDISGARDETRTNLGREDIMMSRTFLKEVVQLLSLQLRTVQYTRSEIFDLVRIDSTAACGAYNVTFYNSQRKDEYIVSYHDTNAISLPFFGFMPGSKSKIIAYGKWAPDIPLHLPGISLKLSRSMREKPRAFAFHVVDIRVAVEEVYRNLTIKRADPDKGINYIAALLSGRDYSLAATTVNSIVDVFIEKNSGFRRKRTHGVVGTLDKQLQLSQAELAAAESKIRDFRSRNPQVGLDQQAQKTVGNLAQIDNGIHSMSTDMANAVRLKNEYLKADSTERLRIAGAITELLKARSIPSGNTLSDELNRLLTNQEAMAGRYGAEHPQVLENNRAINKVSWAIVSALEDFVGSTQNVISNKRQSSQQLTKRLRQLPALEMQLGELERNKKIYEDIYSAVLAGFNKAKVADAVETADFYVMDYAVAPLPPPAESGRLLIFCILFALLISFGPVLVYDIFDKSARSQRQLGRITESIVLEAIPLFLSVNGTVHSKEKSLHPLINVPCDPNYTREIFDSLLVKIKLCLYESTDHCVVVSSFEGGCGKSTISANLAIAIALRGHRVLLVDGDLRRGTVKEIFNLPDGEGFTGLLSGHNPLTDEDCKRSIVHTKIPGLYVLPCGREPPNPGALLSSTRMQEFRRFCGKHMEYAVIDTPPLGIVSDAVAIQKLFAHYIFVVRSGKTKVAELVNRINEFDELPGKILGYVLNAASHSAVGTYRRYSKYYSR